MVDGGGQVAKDRIQTGALLGQWFGGPGDTGGVGGDPTVGDRSRSLLQRRDQRSQRVAEAVDGGRIGLANVVVVRSHAVGLPGDGAVAATEFRDQ
jgi:hypothetical protein